MIQAIDLALAILCNFPQMFVCAQFSTIGTAIHFIIKKKVICDLTAVLQSLYIYYADSGIASFFTIVISAY